MSYKKDIDDMRESPSLKLIEILREKGAKVNYSDPYISKLPPVRKYKFDMKSVELHKESISKYDLLILSTAHSNFNYETIYKHAKIIIDTRNAFESHGVKGNKIYKA